MRNGTLAEETPEAHKDVNAVVQAAEGADLCRKAAHLAQPSFHGPRADLPGVGVCDSALILTAQQVAFDAIAALQRVTSVASQHVPHLP